MAAPHKYILPSELTLAENIPLGNGTYGNVCRGEWKGTPVACKICQMSTRWDEVEHEFELMSLLQHPNIVSFYGVCQIDPRMILVMELCSGGSLRSLLMTSDAVNLSMAQRLALLVDVASGLSYLHSQGVVHGDIKPENVLIANDGRAKVSDFGGSAIPSAGQRVTAVTPRWAEPEVARGGAATFKSDVWSFGSLCFEVITDRKASELLDDAARSQAVQELQNKAQHCGVSRIQSAIASVVQQCWAVYEVRPSIESICSILQEALRHAVGWNVATATPASASITTPITDFGRTVQDALMTKYQGKANDIRRRMHRFPLLYCELKVVTERKSLPRAEQRPAVPRPGQNAANGRAWIDSRGVLAYNKELISVADLFSQRPEERSPPNMVYVIGPAGIGKTTFSWMVALDSIDCSSERHAPLWPQFGWKIHLTLHDIAMTQPELCASAATNVVDLLYHCLFKSLNVGCSISDVRALMRLWKPTNCLLILDGLDEVDITGTQRGLQCLLDFSGTTQLITTRPYGVVSLDDCGRAIEACGFNEGQVETYVRTGLDGDAGTFLEMMNSRPYVMTHSRTPLQLRILCDLWQQDKHMVESGSTVTDLYNAMTRYLLVRDITGRDGQRKMIVDPETKDKMLSVVNERLAAAAWSMIVDGPGGEKVIEQWLSQTQYNKVMRDAPVSMSSDNPLFIERIFDEFYGEPGRGYSFAHYSFQEYYCGRHIAAALMAGPGAPACMSITALIRRYRSDDRYGPMFQYAAGTLAGRDGSAKALGLLIQQCLGDIKQLPMLCSLLDAAKCGYEVSVSDVRSPFSILVEWVAGTCQGSALDVSNCLCGPSGAVVVCAAVRSFPAVTSLRFGGNATGDAGIRSVSEMLREHTRLTSLDLSENHITSRGATTLAEALRTNHTLRVLDISENRSIGDDGIIAIAASLQVNVGLRELRCGRCGFGDRGINALADMLCMNTTLTALVIDGIDVTSRGALSRIPARNNTLRTLEVTGATIVLFVSNLDGRCINVEIDRLEPAEILRRRVCERTHLPFEELQLIYDGVELTGDKTLAEYNVVKESKITMLRRSRIDECTML